MSIATALYGRPNLYNRIPGIDDQVAALNRSAKVGKVVKPDTKALDLQAVFSSGANTQEDRLLRQKEKAQEEEGSGSSQM
ncbi:hypothetical protein Tdes44962_MAKER00865 [Teratosphaeria destructans]|uniref:Uncharacterized protein n=1 Tax=Teratosphaeria destructans TaxID=418781 RepID=A0A9W7VZ23_9PEZI|nr:hypothetical protein Tdes44962_MAKER00865 [Teratosphaeria destructans]